MLERLRQFRRRLAGTLGVLVGSAWLMLAAGPCIAAMQVEMADHCPHCEQAVMPCATIEPADCDLPPVLAATEEFKLKHPVLLPAAVACAAVPDLGIVLRSPAVSATGPPHPPYTQLYCRFQE